MTIKFLFLLIMLSLSSCSLYYSVPFSHPPVLEKKGDLEISANYSTGPGKENGLKFAAMPISNCYFQFNRQQGSFNDSRMKYGYNELSFGYIGNSEWFRFSAGPYFGWGMHRLKYQHWDPAYNVTYHAAQSANLLQAGVQTYGALKLLDDFLVGGSLRLHQFKLINIRRDGDFSKVNPFIDPDNAIVFSPCFSLIFCQPYFKAGFHSGLSVGVNKKIPNMLERYAAFSLSFTINYTEFN